VRYGVGFGEQPEQLADRPMPQRARFVSSAQSAKKGSPFG